MTDDQKARALAMLSTGVAQTVVADVLGVDPLTVFALADTSPAYRAERHPARQVQILRYARLAGHSLRDLAPRAGVSVTTLQVLLARTDVPPGPEEERILRGEQAVPPDNMTLKQAERAQAREAKAAEKAGRRAAREAKKAEKDAAAAAKKADEDARDARLRGQFDAFMARIPVVKGFRPD